MMKQFVTSIIIVLTLFNFRAEAQSQVRTLKHGNNAVTSVRFMPDGKRLVSTDFYGTVVLWNVQTGKSIWRNRLDGVRNKDAYTISHIYAMDVSPDGRTIAVSYDRSRVLNNRLLKDEESRIGLLDAKDGRERQVLTGSTARGLRLTFSPDGSLLASGGPDGIARLWDVSTGRQIDSNGAYSGVAALSFSPDGKLLAIGQAGINSRRIILWNRESEAMPKSIRIEDGSINDAAFSPAGGLLAVVTQVPYEITLFSTQTWQSVRAINNPEVNADLISFSSDGHLLASGEAGAEGGRIFVWETTGNSKPRSYKFRTGVQTINFSPDGSTLAAGTEDGKVLLLRL